MAIPQTIVQPTVLTDTKPEMSVIREEIFGPVIGRAKPGFQLWGRETGINPDRANVAWPLGDST